MQLSSISPASGPAAGGTILILTGDSFGSSAAYGSITVGGQACPVSSGEYSNTAIECVVPVGLGTDQLVVVTVATQASVDVRKFSYDAPVLDSIFYLTASTV